VYDNTDDDREDTARERACEPSATEPGSGVTPGPAALPGEFTESAGQRIGPGGLSGADTSIPTLASASAGQRKLTSTARIRGAVMLALSCVRIATADQLSMVVTDNRVGVGYTLRALRDLEALGLVGHGRHGRSKVWHLTTSGQRAVAEGGDVPVRPHAATGERAIAAGLAAHGLGVTDVMIAFGGHLLDWEVEVDHSIDKVRRVVTDAVLRRDSHGAEVELLEFDRGTMSVARLAAKLRTYQAYSQATFHEGERGTIGTTKYVWRERYRRSRYFPVIRLVLDGGDKATLERRTEALRQQVRGIQLRVVVAPLRMLQKPGDEWAWEPIGIDDDEARQVA